MLLKKAGMVVLGAAAGVAALSGTAFAGDYQGTTSTGPAHSWDRDGGHHHHGHHHGPRGGDFNDNRDSNNSVAFSDDDNNATALGGTQTNTGDQLIGVNNTNLQAPISAAASILGDNIF